MGVYINGMEIPKKPVLFCIHPDGKVFADLEGGWGEYNAIPVPPHGRLIDVDKLEEEVCCGCKRGCIDCAIANAPTVIPADKDGET